MNELKATHLGCERLRIKPTLVIAEAIATRLRCEAEIDLPLLAALHSEALGNLGVTTLVKQR